MQSIPTPTKLEFQDTDEPNISKVIIEPCYPGYGTTLGNTLRRVLLSSLPGGAVTSFKIKNVLHEFTGVENVKEDVVEITLNLKELRLKVFTDEPVRLKLHAKGEKVVTPADIEPNSDVEIANMDMHIATLTDKNADFEMELIVSSGRGYSATETREDEMEVGMIPIDSLFNPVVRVNFTVDNVRVGHMTNWDKIILEIETDGSITPRDALSEVSQYLIDHFDFIKNASSQESVVATEKEDESDEATPDKTESEEEGEKESTDEVVEEEKKPEAAEEEATPKKRGRPKKEDKEE